MSLVSVSHAQVTGRFAMEEKILGHFQVTGGKTIEPTTLLDVYTDLHVLA